MCECECVRVSSAHALIDHVCLCAHVYAGVDVYLCTHIHGTYIDEIQ